MMISPEAYYEMNLKGKDKTQLLSAIRGLKNEIGRLKNIMEHPDYGNEHIMHPSECVRISCNREYLDRAIQALEEMGGVYQPSKAEMKAADFQDNLKFISKITIEIGGFFTGTTKHIIEFDKDKARFKSSMFDFEAGERIIDKEEIIWLLSRLYIGEWRKYYDPKRFGYYVMDGTQWNVSFEYSNGHKIVEFAGSNDYPYNFREFMEIFGLEDEVYSEDDE